jgi:hypothetical protein
MKIEAEENKFLSQWKHYEVARFVPNLNRVIRDKKNNLPLMLLENEVSDYSKANNNTGIYTSVFAYNSIDIDSAVRFGPLYFDLDSSDLDLAKEDTIKLYEELSKYIPSESILVFFTGKKGFHVECEPIAIGINPSNDLAKIYRYIANDIKNKLSLQTLDFSVYDPRRMWRYPNSKHQSTGLHKVLLNSCNSDNLLFKDTKDILEYAAKPQSLEVCEQSFSYKANEWYRNYTYLIEEDSKRKDDPLEYFNKYGSTAFKNVAETKKVFDKKMLLSRCSAIGRLYEQAKEQHSLEHEARLFLCSVLTYTEDSIKFLHEILSNCHDYNFEKSSAHINDWIKRRQMGVGGRPYTCERANSVGVGCGACSLDQRNKWVKVGNRYIETQEKSSPSPIRFAYRSMKEDENNGQQS